MHIFPRKLILSLTCLILLGVAPFCFSGEYYSWIDENGRMHYSNQKPTNNANIKIINFKENHKTTDKAPTHTNKLKQTTRSDTLKTRSALPGYKGLGSGTVVMYSTAWCGYCKKARRYFRENNIPFNEYDIEKSSRAKNEHKRHGGSGVPLLLFGQQKMRGFSVDHFEKLYYR